jgi:hypothetical protein
MIVKNNGNSETEAKKEIGVNRDKIIRMAREAGFEVIEEDEYRYTHIIDTLCHIDVAVERFANLVAAAEREKILVEGWRQCSVGQRTTQFCELIEQAIVAEREECAKVCESDPTMPAILVADAIRARGQNV